MLVLLIKGTGRSGGAILRVRGMLVVGGGAEMKGMICFLVTFHRDMASQTGV